jgi:hypothetical protein
MCMSQPQGRPQARAAVDVARPLELSAEARAALVPGHTPRQYLDVLLQLSHQEDAIRFLAAALPKREAVWWACLCLREALPAPWPPAAVSAVEAAERWVKEPRDANRRSARDAAEAAGWGTPPGCVAAAAFWSGGSLAPANLPAVQPRDELTPVGVAGALLLAAAIDPVQTQTRYASFLKSGLEIASGGRRWEGQAAS